MTGKISPFYLTRPYSNACQSLLNLTIEIKKMSHLTGGRGIKIKTTSSVQTQASSSINTVSSMVGLKEAWLTPCWIAQEECDPDYEKSFPTLNIDNQHPINN